MTQQSTALPSGPRVPRGTRTSKSPQPPISRGGIQKRNGGLPRVDRDGDLDMDGPSGNGRGRGRGARGGRGRGSALTGPRNHHTKGLLDPNIDQKIALGVASGTAQVRDRRGEARIGGALIEASGERRNRDLRINYLQTITVRGWTESKAASNEGGGIKELLAFLTRKATPKTSTRSEMVRIEKHNIKGDTLYISVRPEDAEKFTRLNNFEFAGAALRIEPLSRPSTVPRPTQALTGSGEVDAISLMERIKTMLARRYIFEQRLLDMSSLGSDPEFVKDGSFETAARQGKLIAATVKVCNDVFSSSDHKRDAVFSLTLANNSLPDLSTVMALCQTFPDIKNLDLSNNDLTSMASIEAWKSKFRHLDHLILTGNPLENTVPDYKTVVMRWYPKLRTLNGTQVRSDEDIAAAVATKTKLPLAILPPSFCDEAAIGENFLKRFFPTYDTDRTTLASAFYDAESTFSLSVNVNALRAAVVAETKVHPWDNYIKKSRNLNKITTLGGRMERVFRGMENIRDVWMLLPSSRHPSLLGEPQKWCIECHPMPGLPDLSGQSVAGVGGLIVMVHGEFGEVDVSTGNIVGQRSFDRTFVLGPGTGELGIRVVNDVLVIRAYGGFDAWQTYADAMPTQYEVPDGLGTAAPGKSAEQLQKEIYAMELSKVTRMTLEYSVMCLEQSGWNLEEAAKRFEEFKASLPAEAFFQN